MTARTFEEALADSRVLAALALAAGVDLPAARRLLAALADVPIVQVSRMTKTANDGRTRQANRMTRKR